jgi:hypothetical protein
MAYPGRKKERIIAAPNETNSIAPMENQLLYMCSKSGSEKTEQIKRHAKNTITKMIFELYSPPFVLFLSKSILFEELIGSLLPY